MASAPVGTIQGLASNIQWQDMIDQIMSQDQTRLLDPITNRITADKTSISTWGQYQSLVSNLQSAASALSTSAFDSMQGGVATDPSGTPLASVTASSSATPGTYQVEVLSLASVDKVGGANLASATTALHLTGEFFVNGKRVSVADGDTLNDIRDKINALTSGASGTGVSASVITAGTTQNRLELAAGTVGASGVQIADGTGGVLAALGLVSSADTPAVTSDGGSQSFRFSDASTSIGTLLGATSVPGPTTIAVGNTTISVDLANDSLNSIQQKLTAAGVTASVDTVSFNGQTFSRLDVAAPIAGVPGDANSAQVAQLLGFIDTRAAVAQTVTDSSVWTDAGGAPATASTALSALNVDGTATNLAAGDSIVIRGTRGDGTAVSTTLTLTGTETVQSLLDQINSATMLGNSRRSATATIGTDGKLTVTDGTAGASQLSLSLTVNKASGGTATLGQISTQVTGYDRELAHGSDASLRVDGTLITRSSNTVTDAVPGLTINLLAAEPGTTANVSVTRNTNAAVSAAQLLVSAYNSVASFVKTQTAAGAPLAFNMSLRASLRSLTDTLIGNVTGLTGSYQRAGSVGLTLDKTGQLNLDTTVFTNALTSDIGAVKALFSANGTASAGLTYVADSTKTKAGTFAVQVTQAASQATLSGTGFTGTYTDSGSPDTVTITDGTTFATGSVSLATGDTMDNIVDKFNSLFASQNMQLIASNVGGQLQIVTKAYGSAAKISLSYGGSTNPQSQLGIAAGLVSGVDVAGTIDGVAATGVGQQLTGAAGSNVDGLVLTYAGTAPYTGQVVHTVGVGAMLNVTADSITRSGDGLIAGMTNSLQGEIDSLTARSTAVQSQLDQRRAAMTAQFTAMEAVLSKLQAQSTDLANQIKGLQTSGN
jgi:flagellar hook-associated protein 2